jgi:hypothetical protein
LSFLLLMHDRLSITVMMFWGAVGLWGLLSWIRGGSLSGSQAGAFAIGEVLVIIQVLAGVGLVINGVRPPDPTHYLYGATGILALPFAWSYYRDRDQRMALIVYSLISLFIFGLAIRGMATGSA